MAVSYKRLWKMLIDKNMKKSDLEKKAHLTHYSMSKLAKEQDVSTDVLYKICSTMRCKVEDIMEFVDEKQVDIDVE